MSCAKRLPFGCALRLELARFHHLDAIRRLTRAIACEDQDRTLAEAQVFGALALALTERVKTDLVFWRVEVRLLEERW